MADNLGRRVNLGALARGVRASLKPWAAAAVLLTSPLAAAGTATWPEGSTQVVISDLQITGTLIVERGVTVQLSAGVEIVVAGGGTLEVRGDAEAPVRFTSGGEARWDGLRFAAGASGVVRHAIIEHTQTAGLSIVNASPTIEDSVIHDVLGAAPGGIARGILVTGASAAPTISRCLVQDVVGAQGAAGANTAPAPAGPDGADGTFFFPNADDGGVGSGGGIGGAGGAGGMAVGIDVEANGRPILLSNRVRRVTGGQGGPGGKGGNGGNGGDGGVGFPQIIPGSSGNGGNGGPGGKGGPGGVGGVATGLESQSSAGDLHLYQHLVTEISGGAGGTGGDGGEGGPGGAGGNAGNGGLARAVSVSGGATFFLAQSTLAQVSAGAPGSPGLANFGGLGGVGGGAAPNGEVGEDGQRGGPGGPGSAGAPGQRQGMGMATSAHVEITNSIVALGAPASGVAVAASGGATATVQRSCLSGFATATEGPIGLLEGTLLVDPQFADAAAGSFELAAGSPCIDAGGDGPVPFRRRANSWKAIAGEHEARAFDEFAPGIAGFLGCLAGDGETVVFELESGTVSFTALLDAGGLGCAVTDGSTLLQVSDGGGLAAGVSRLRIDFDPPVRAFYAYVSSLAVGHTATMTPYASAAALDPIQGLSSPNSVAATGLGMVGAALIDRIDVTVTDTDSVLGAFTGLATGEETLGAVFIPGYAGPSGSTIALDFACAFGPGVDALGAPRLFDGDDDGDAAVDMGALEFQGVSLPPCPADLDGNGEVDGADFGMLLSAWGVDGPADLSGDGVVDGVDLGALLGAWGACPE